MSPQIVGSFTQLTNSQCAYDDAPACALVAPGQGDEAVIAFVRQLNAIIAQYSVDAVAIALTVDRDLLSCPNLSSAAAGHKQVCRTRSPCTALHCTALHCTDVTGIVCDDDAILQPPTPVIVARYMSDVLTHGGNAEVRFCPDVDCEGRYHAAFGLTRFQVRACVHTCSPCV